MDANKTLAVGFSVDTQITDQVSEYDITFKPEIDFESRPRGGAYPHDSDIKFVAIPTRFWNDITRFLQTALTENQRRPFSIGSSFRISHKNIASKPLPAHHQINFLVKINTEYDKERCTLRAIVRWGDNLLDREQYPFVVCTIACWNNFQRLLDSEELAGLDLRRQLRRYRPMAIPVPISRVYWVNA